jgi:hypothetical protein
VFGSVLESSRLPPTTPRAHHGSGVDGAWVGSCGGCLVRSLLGGEVFPHEAMRWMGSLPPCTSLWLIAEYRGDSACL